MGVGSGVVRGLELTIIEMVYIITHKMYAWHWRVLTDSITAAGPLGTRATLGGEVKMQR